MIKPIETGFDDSFVFSPLWTEFKEKKSLAKSAKARPLTPPSVDQPDQEEFELFFSIVSDDGFAQSGKNLEEIWNGLLDQLENDHTFPGAAPRSTRPNVYKVLIQSLFLLASLIFRLLDFRTILCAFCWSNCQMPIVFQEITIQSFSHGPIKHSWWREIRRVQCAPRATVVNATQAICSHF